MLEITGLLLGIMGIVFAFETPRQMFVNFFGGKSKKQLSLQTVSDLLIKTSATNAPASAATQSGRTPFFISEPVFDLAEAKVKSRESDKPLFLVIYDDEHPSKSKLDYSLGCFLEYFTTKKLLEQHYVCALLPASVPGVRAYVPENYPLENALLVITSADGEILRREGVYANLDEGLKRVRSVIAQLHDV